MFIEQNLAENWQTKLEDLVRTMYTDIHTSFPVQFLLVTMTPTFLTTKVF
jgi:hypothetical protein